MLAVISGPKLGKPSKKDLYINFCADFSNTIVTVEDYALTWLPGVMLLAVLLQTLI